MSKKDPDAKYMEKFFGLLWGGDDDDAPEKRLAALKKAIDLADSRNDLNGGMLARLEYLRVTEFSGRYDEGLVAFAWCLGVCDKNPELLEAHGGDILWIFKWISGSISRFAGITRKQIQDTLQQMTRYYERAGLSMRAIHGLRASNALDLGDLHEVAKHRAAWQAAPKDGSEDCAACETGGSVGELVSLGEFESALRVSQPLLKGRLTCSVQPQAAQTTMLIPLFRLKKWALADETQRTAAAKVRGNPNHLDDMATHAAFLAVTDQLTRGVSMMEAGFAHLLNVRRSWDQMAFYKGIRVLLLRLSEKPGKTIKLRLPVKMDIYRKDSIYSVADILKFADSQGRAIAAQFDKRNGNTYMSRTFTEWDDLLDQVHPITRKRG